LIGFVGVFICCFGKATIYRHSIQSSAVRLGSHSLRLVRGCRDALVLAIEASSLLCRRAHVLPYPQH
jgi:hypothetical protein